MFFHLIKRFWVQILSVILAAATVVVVVIAVNRTPDDTIQTIQTGTTDTTTSSSVSVTDTTTTTVETTTHTVATTPTKKTTVRKTTKKTTRRTVAPPPIVVEPDNVTDDTAKKPDDSISKPVTPNGVTIQHVKQHFGGAGNLIGIDVARHQGTIDWKKVKQAGISFAIIRCGYRTTVGGQVYADANFKTNVEGALAAGIPIGIYFFSAAKNETEALEEAAFVIEVLKPYKDKITWPVAYDFEIFDQDRLKGVDYTTISNNALAFMDVIAAQGYTPMLYSSRNMLRDQFETARLSSYRVWMAQYVNTLDQKKYNGDHVMWQCASDGRVDGIQGDVDLNIAYRDLGNAPSPVLPAPDPDTFPVDFTGFSFKNVCDEVKMKKAVGLRISPFVDRPNIWTTAKKDALLLRTGVDEKNGWSRLLVNGVIVYTKTSNLTFVRTTVTTTTTIPTTVTTTTEVTTTESESTTASTTENTTTQP